MKLRRKMLVWIVLPTLTIYVVVLGITMTRLSESARLETEQRMSRLAANYAARFDAAFRAAAAVADTTARQLTRSPVESEDAIFDILRGNVEHDPLIHGAAMAFEPGTLKPADVLYAPYVHRNGDQLAQMNITRDIYDWYRDDQWQWWHLPKKMRRGVWTAPYFDDGAGSVLMTTYATPFFNGDAFHGVTTVDIMLPNLREKIGREILGRPEFVILTDDAQYVYHPKKELIMTFIDFDGELALSRPDLVDVVRDIISGEAGVATVDGWDTPEPQSIFYAPIASTGWAFAIRLPQREVLATVRQNTITAVTALAATLALIVGCIWFISGRITRPIEKLRAKALEIAGGHLEVRVDDIHEKGEIGDLADSFNTMTADLRSHIERLASEEAARAKMERDLNLARDIQQGLLPREVPPLPGYDLAGWSQPADQTGGDYYDWQLLPNGRLAVSLADVTGHGIGPALVTAVCRAYGRASFPSQEALAVLMNRINDLLHEDLELGRFVTFVAGFLDASTHRMDLLSAGHGPLLLFTAADQRVQAFDAHGIPMGLDSDVGYGPPQVIEFAHGDMLVLMTDGFFEWANAQGEQYGVERLIDVIGASHDRAAEEIIERMVTSVRAFVGDVEQDDDLTAVVLKRTSDAHTE